VGHGRHAGRFRRIPLRSLARDHARPRRDLTRPEFDATFGQRNDAILRRLVDSAISDAESPASATRRRRTTAPWSPRRDPPARRALDWLRALAGAGWRQAIASSGPRANTEAINDALGLHGVFAAIVAAEDVTHGKPHPEVFLTAAARLGVAPARCRRRGRAAGIEAGQRRHADHRRPVEHPPSPPIASSPR
jgi:beta-phosphoglucomutase